MKLRDALRHALVEEGVKKIDAWTARYRLVEVAFPAEAIDPFFNMNRPEDLAEAEELLKKGRGGGDVSERPHSGG